MKAAAIAPICHHVSNGEVAPGELTPEALTVNWPDGAPAAVPALMLYAPGEEAGIAKLQANSPFEFVFPAQRTVEEFQFTEYEASAENPRPVAVTAVPTGPEDGLTARLAVMVREAVVERVPPRAVTVPAPPGAMGTANVQENQPAEEVVPEQSVAEAFQETV